MAESKKQETIGLEGAVPIETAPTKIEATKEQVVQAEEVTGERSVTEALEPTIALNILEADPEADGPGVVVCTYSFVTRLDSRLTMNAKDDDDSGFGDARRLVFLSW